MAGLFVLVVVICQGEAFTAIRAIRAVNAIGIGAPVVVACTHVEVDCF